MKIQVLDFQTEGAISILQIATEEKNTLEFISSGKAIEKQLIEVTEVSDSGSVNNLKVENKSGQYVFFMDGDILIGAKQNRVLNVSVMVEPNKVVDIPVSCVEAGRWGYRRRNFYSADYSAPAQMRFSKTKGIIKNLMRGKGFYADQSDVWENVSAYEEKYQKRSATSDFNLLYSEENTDFKPLNESFKLKDGANGLVIFKGKKMLSTDIFNREEIFGEYFGKILKGISLDLSDESHKESNLSKEEAKERVENFFEKYEELNFTTEKGVGIGEHKRFEAKNLVVTELSNENKPVHISVLAID